MDRLKIWGFLEVNGERRYSRLLKFTGPKSEDIEARLVYDYGELSIPHGCSGPCLRKRKCRPELSLICRAVHEVLLGVDVPLNIL